ncbi:hypothetical protein CEXT_754742 [Caerostris extrusa]|uniref:3',5'-cyclic-AMP phosphodiesterase n=1 Tax=Caerostris extrusa TaxID=172846 RepID=A0AAV4MTD9_CAEEX|nr:hypothetical protein CEXT_754742 [Caerostris extrusa]
MDPSFLTHSSSFIRFFLNPSSVGTEVGAPAGPEFENYNRLYLPKELVPDHMKGDAEQAYHASTSDGLTHHTSANCCCLGCIIFSVVGAACALAPDILIAEFYAVTHELVPITTNPDIIIPYYRVLIWFVESHNLGVCLNELIQIHHTDISYLLKLRAAQALFSALDSCREGIIVTNLDHNIQYANKASEKLLGYTVEDLCGKNAQTLCRAESVKADIAESINMQVKKGKDWEGTLFHKRKSGENLPLWSRIQSVEIYSGHAELLIHVNECPFNEKSFATEPADLLPFVKAPRKGSCDVRTLSGESGLNRRQSFAKFHPMTLEPPITKVINMILATQEHSPLFVVQALDRVLDILRSTDIYSPQFTGIRQNHADDSVASDLFSGLISNSKQVIRRFSHEAFKGVPSSGAVAQLPLTPSAVPTLANAPEKVKELLEDVKEWHCDIIQLEKISEKRPLIWVGMAIFASFNACNLLNCDESVLRNWLSMIESNYHSNTYHNSTHAADVLQATAYFLQKPRLKAIFDPIDEIVSLVAAAIHDVDHPGKTVHFCAIQEAN